MPETAAAVTCDITAAMPPVATTKITATHAAYAATERTETARAICSITPITAVKESHTSLYVNIVNYERHVRHRPDYR